MRYELNTMNDTAIDPMTAVFFEVQSATGLLTYLILALIMFVVFWVGMKRTQDIGKSGATALLIGSFTAIIMYYWGLTGNYANYFIGKEFFGVIPLFTLVIFTIITILVVKFYRINES